MTYNQLPCTRCPVLPICRHKDYGALIDQCNNIFDYLLDCEMPDPHKSRCTELEACLRPTVWKLGEQDEKGFDMIHLIDGRWVNKNELTL